MLLQISVSLLFFPFFLYAENLTFFNQQELHKALRQAAFSLIFKRERGKTVIAPLSLDEFTYAHRLITFQKEILGNLTKDAERASQEIASLSLSDQAKKRLYQKLAELYRFDSLSSFTSFSEIHAYLEQKSKALAEFREKIEIISLSQRWEIQEEALLSLFFETREKRELFLKLSQIYQPHCRLRTSSSPDQNPWTYTLRLHHYLVVVYAPLEQIESLKRKVESQRYLYTHLEALLALIKKEGVAFEVFQEEKEMKEVAFLGTLWEGFKKGAFPPLFELKEEELQAKLACLGYEAKKASASEILEKSRQPLPLCTLYYSGSEPQDLFYASPCP